MILHSSLFSKKREVRGGFEPPLTVLQTVD